MDQLVQVFGSLLILAAFYSAQRGWLSTDGRVYLWLNLIGASILALLAAYEAQYGFLLLEASWMLVAAHSLLRIRTSRRGPAGAGRSTGSRSRPARSTGHSAGRCAGFRAP